MPGHKGRALPAFPELAGAYAWDITEISGADSLFEADGILRASENLTVALWGSGDCCWSAGGSTLCIQAMLAKMKAENRRIIAARTVHRAFLNACVLLGLEVTWVRPRSGGLIAGEYAREDFAAALEACHESACIYVTSPDYCGNLQDIAGLAALCREHGAKLLVDNAHGAHLAFLSENRHPMTLGADFCCDSFHKMLPSLTGAAVLHCREHCGMEMKQYMQLFGSTSPSYLIMQSIEGAVSYLNASGRRDILTCEERANVLRRALPGYDWVGDDPLHLTARCDGNALAEALRERGIECEYADRTCIVLLLSPVMEKPAFARLQAALEQCRPRPAAEMPDLPEPAEQVLPMREAALAAWEEIPLEQAENRICGPVQVPCPPAVPLMVSGERLDREWVDYLRWYGAERALVVIS